MRFSTGSRLGPYEIAGPIGEGGMGEVYRAIDTRLARPVAIKILSEGLRANHRAMSRFEREARAIAALTHPNILSIFEFDVEGATPFVVTELLEGAALRERMTGRIPWRKAVELAAAIAEGLAAAHAHGITHRDLKPENVFITTDGRVKILDFGIAHVRESELDPSDTAPTAEYRADAPLGTIGYVAPEQIRRREPEPTSDIFSLGVILYEMIAGANPFRRATAMETLAAILDDDPPPLGSVTTVPAALEHLVHRCLEKNPERRAQSARDLADQLREILRPRAAEPRRRRVVRFAAAAVAIAAGIAAFLYVSGRNGFTPRGASAAQAVTTIAILPLVNATGDPRLDYLSDGITESLINQLSELPNVRVTARPTVFQFKGKAADPLDVGKQLAVGAIATGKVAAHGETLRVQADLIDTTSGTQIWGGSFDALRKERAALPARLARQIAKELELTLTRAQTSRFSAEAETDPAAFDLFLQGLDALHTETAEGRLRAIGLLEKAVQADPDFARAHAALAEAYVRYSTTTDPRLMFRKAGESVARALAADPNLAEAHLSRGIILFWSDWDFAGAEQEYRRALALSPSLAAANAYYAELLQCAGDFDAGIRQAQRARELDPLSRGSAIALAAAYLYAGSYGEARAELTRLLRGNPDFPSAHVLMGRVLHLTGDLAGACAEYTLADELSNTPADQVKARRAACEAHGVAGYNRELLRVLESDPSADPYLIGGLYAELGEREKALEHLEIAYRGRATGMLLIKSDPAFAAIRSDPRFVDLMKRVGFPAADGRAGAGG